MPMNDGSPINRESVFDEFAIGIPDLSSMEASIWSYIYAGDERVGYIRSENVYRHRTFDETDPEVIEIQRRLDAGECTLHYIMPRDAAIHPWDELQKTQWYIPTIFPFHERGVDPHHFFHALGIGADWRVADAIMPQRFMFPGLVEGASRRYYCREDDVDSPDVNALSELAGLGWTDFIPYGSHQLYAVDIMDSPGGVSISGAQRIHHRRKSLEGALRSIARKWHEYWSGLTPSEKGINTRMTLEKHIKHAIGRAWAEKPYMNGIRVFHERESGARQRSFRDAEDWMVGNLEQWAFSLGFHVMAAALADGGNRVALEVQLDDYTFCLIKPDGTVGDRLANPNEGILVADWNAWGTTHYNAALGTIIEGVSAGPDVSYHVSEASVQLEGSGTVTNGAGMPDMLWERVSGFEAVLGAVNMSALAFTGPVLEAGDDPVEMVLRFTLSNNGESASDTVTVTFNPPAAPEE